MSCKIYRIRNGRETNFRKDPEKLLKLVLDGRCRELLIEVDERLLNE
ncbi:MAG: hypothetical protein GXO26_02180 [Crenarchaeota archaeon]|nr:hypothetical protein [Thermoproteota archaeon]